MEILEILIGICRFHVHICSSDFRYPAATSVFGLEVLPALENARFPFIEPSIQL